VCKFIICSYKLNFKCLNTTHFFWGGGGGDRVGCGGEVCPDTPQEAQLPGTRFLPSVKLYWLPN